MGKLYYPLLIGSNGKVKAPSEDPPDPGLGMITAFLISYTPVQIARIHFIPIL